jgi:hypothetical protein
MPWYVYIAWLFAGAFLANSIPHTVQGICGNRFQTPFASSPGVGESSAVVNVVWGFVNLAIGGALLHILALWLANHFGKVRNAPPHP